MRRRLRRWAFDARRYLRDPWLFVMTLVGSDETRGSTHVPTDWRSGHIYDPWDGGSRLSLFVNNDAFELSVRREWPDRGKWTEGNLYGLNRREARLLAWWIVRWFAADWFGVRRRLYYFALSRHLAPILERNRRLQRIAEREFEERRRTDASVETPA